MNSRLPRFLRNFATVLLIAAASALSTPAFAKDDVVVELTAHKVVASAGAEKMESAEKAKPGDVLQYEANYRNDTKAAVSNLQATLPIPDGLELLLESAKPAGAQASLDGKIFAPLPLTREVAGADGKKTNEPVPAREIRALRWSAPQLAAGEKFTVSARAKVLTNQSIPQTNNHAK